MTALEVLPLASDVELPGAVVAGELVAQVITEQPALASLDPREQLLAAAWLLSYRSARTRRAYAGDFTAWRAWLHSRDLDVLAARRAHVDLWVSQLQAAGAAASTITRRLSALAGLYRYAAAHDLVAVDPTAGVARPAIDPDYTATISLDRDQARAFITAADADPGRQQPRTAAVIRLLLHNALRVDELVGADLSDLGYDRGDRVLHVTRKGARRARVPLAPATVAALKAYLAARAAAAGITVDALDGPLVATASVRRLTQAHL